MTTRQEAELKGTILAMLEDFSYEASRKLIIDVLREKEKETVLPFKVGQRVKFRDRWDKWQKGIITKKNSRTVSLTADDGTLWRMSPTYLTKCK